MSFLHRLDLNVDPLLAKSWLALAFYQSLRTLQEEVML